MSNNSHGWNLGEKEKKGLVSEVEYAVLVGVAGKKDRSDEAYPSSGTSLICL